MSNIGKVIVRPITRTTISSSNFNPKPNVSLPEIKDVNTSSQQNGDVLVYDAATGKYVMSPIDTANLNIKNIFGGYF